MAETLMVDADIWLHDFLQVPSMQLQQVKEYKIEKFLQGAHKLSFRLSLGDPKLSFLHEDQLIKAEDSYWYIEKITDTHPGDKTITCNARHITELTWKIKFGNFSVLAQTPAAGLALILTGSDWTVGSTPASVQLYTMEEIDASTLTLLRRWAAVTGFELEFDDVNKEVSLVEAVGTLKPIGFRWGYSLREVTRDYFPPQATRLYPIGANNLTISDVNPLGLPYIEDYSFYEAQGLTTIQAREKYRKDLPWVDERYLLAVNLYDAAVARLAKLSQPRVFYSAKVLDLTKLMNGDPGYEVGDTTIVDDEELGVLENVRVTRTVRYPRDPKKDEVELGFQTNGLLDVTDGGNRSIDYSRLFTIVDQNDDSLVIGATTVNYNTIALTSAGAATFLSGSTFVGVATGTGTISWRMVVDGVVVGREYSRAFTNGEILEFSWPSFSSDLAEGAHVVDWRAQVTSGSGTVALAAEHGRSWVLSSGAVGVGINASPNAFIAELMEEDDFHVVIMSDEVTMELLMVPVTTPDSLVEETMVDGDFPVVVMTDLIALPWKLEDPVFGEIDSFYSISGPEDPIDLGFGPYHPPPGGAEGGSINFGPGTVDPTTFLELLGDHNATNYWPLQTARADGVSEPDQIGTDHMTMRSGATTLAGEGPFGGSDDSVIIVEADSEYYETTNVVDWAQSFSVSFFVKMATASSSVPILMSTGTATTNGWYLIHRDDHSGLTNQFTHTSGTSYLDFGTGDRNIENDGLWHHVALTRQYNATASLDTFRLYLDGVKVAEATRSAIGSIDMGISKMSLGDRLPATGSALTCPGRYAHAARALGVVWSDAQIAEQAAWT
jgi:phage minor structural protein